MPPPNGYIQVTINAQAKDCIGAVLEFPLAKQNQLWI